MGEAYRTWIILYCTKSLFACVALHAWRQLRGLYENGWFVGEIQYFNRSSEEYCVTFQDGSSDYVTNDDIDGTDLILL